MLGETIMFDRLGHVTFHHRRLVLALAGAFLALGALWGTGVFGSMVSSGFETPGSESAQAQAKTEATVGRGGADVVVMYRDGGRTVDDPAFRSAVEAHLASLPRDLVASTTTTWTAGPDAARFVSADRRSTYAVVQLTGSEICSARAMSSLTWVVMSLLMAASPPSRTSSPGGAARSAGSSWS